ncbi:MAG: class I adenylate-forming enzyme family protein [Acidimicrobiales bacterium]
MNSVVELLSAAADRQPNRTALVTGKGSITFRDLWVAVDRCSNGMSAVGVRESRSVVLALPNSLEFVVALFAILRLGAVAVPLDPRWRKRELEAPIRECRPVLMISRHRFWHNDLGAALGDLGCTLSPRPATCFVDAKVGGPPAEGSTSWEQLCSGTGATKLLQFDGGVAGEEAVVLYTSGVGDRPKSVRHSQQGLVACVRSLEETHKNYFAGKQRVRRIAKTLLKYRGRLLRPAMGRQIWFTPLSFHGIAGLSLLLQCLCTGQTLVTVEVFDPSRVLDLWETQHVTTAAMSPSMAEHLLRAQRRKPSKTASLLVLGLGSSPVRPELVGELQDTFGCAVPVGYGSTELGGGVLATNITDSQSVQANTVGRPFPGVEVRIVDENGAGVPVGQVGELWCRGGALMLGYGGKDEGEGIDEDGWYHTKDLASIDVDGNVAILGRMSDLIIRGGKNVYAFEIERELCEHPDILKAAVISLPDNYDERVCAFIETRSKHPDVPEIRHFLSARLAAYKIPQEFRTIDDWPLSADEKILKSVLRNRATLPESASESPSELHVAGTDGDLAG